MTGAQALFGGPAVADNPVNEAGAFTVTSDVLPVDQFPPFASESVADYIGAQGDFIPVEGAYAAGASHADDAYMRVGRTFDLSAIAAAEAPTFAAQFSSTSRRISTMSSSRAIRSGSTTGTPFPI